MNETQNGTVPFQISPLPAPTHLICESYQLFVKKKMEGVDDEVEVDNTENLEEKCDGTLVAERTKKKKKKKKPAGI